MNTIDMKKFNMWEHPITRALGIFRRTAPTRDLKVMRVKLENGSTRTWSQVKPNQWVFGSKAAGEMYVTSDPKKDPVGKKVI